jgi:hypothetical protein
VKPLIIAALIVVPFVLFIAAALVYQSQTGTDIVTGEKTGVPAEKWGEDEVSKIKDIVNNPSANCDPSYPAVCIPPYPPDLDCDEIIYTNFMVVGSDPHGFDKDNDGIGCEK